MKTKLTLLALLAVAGLAQAAYAADAAQPASVLSLSGKPLASLGVPLKLSVKASPGTLAASQTEIITSDLWPSVPRDQAGQLFLVQHYTPAVQTDAGPVAAVGTAWNYSCKGSAISQAWPVSYGFAPGHEVVGGGKQLEDGALTHVDAGVLDAALAQACAVKSAS